MEGNGSTSLAASNGGVAIEIPLAATVPPSGFLQKRGRRFWEIVHRHPVTAGNLVVTESALVIDARAILRGRWEIPWKSLRKVVVDDGERWGYVASICRFPVYDDRSNGSGSGALIGPLWSQAASLVPPTCPQLVFDPVPVEAPNVALILDPVLAAPSRRSNGAGGQDRPVAVVMVRAQNPDFARLAIASRAPLGDIDHDDLAFLATAGSPRNGGPPSANGTAPLKLPPPEPSTRVSDGSRNGHRDSASSPH